MIEIDSQRRSAIRLSILGYGSIAEEHVKSFKRLGGVTLDSVMGRVQESAEEFAGRHGFVHATTDLDETLARDSDAVVITSPSDIHADQTEACLRAGKHTLCEIPLSTELGGSERVAALAASCDKRLMICHTQRFSAPLQALRQRIADGDFHPSHVLCRWGFLRRENKNWTGRQRSWTDNLLWHHGCHVIDMAIWMLGETDIVDVKGTLAPPGDLGIPLDLNMSFETASGAIVTVAMSYNTHWAFHDYMFVGEEDAYLYDGGKLRSKDGVIAEGGPSAMDAQNGEFLAAIRENREPIPSAVDVLPAMRVLQAVQDQNE